MRLFPVVVVAGVIVARVSGRLWSYNDKKEVQGAPGQFRARGVSHLTLNFVIMQYQ